MKKVLDKYLHRSFLITVGFISILVIILTTFKVLYKYQEARKLNSELLQSISGNEESIKNLQSETATLKSEDLRKTNDCL